MICERQSKTAEIASRFKQELQSRRLNAGSAVESVRELAAKYQISTVTADRVLKVLVQDDFLYRVPQAGTFIKHDPPVIPMIGYAAYLPSPESRDAFLPQASRSTLKLFTDAGCEPVLISYHELLDPAAAEAKLAKLNGLFLSVTFIDAKTLPQILKFHGRIVVVGNTFIEERFPCSQVIPDFLASLLELRRKIDFEQYRNFMILTAGHPNARGIEKALHRFFQLMRISEDRIFTQELIVSNNSSAELAAFRHFRKEQNNFQDTLIFSTSDYFSMGIRAAFQERQANMPDLLSFDNLEEHQPCDSDQEGCFTCIDRELEKTYTEGASLLLKLIRENDYRHHAILIPPHFIIRKSIRHIKQEKGTDL